MHIQEIVDSSMVSEQVKVEEYPSQVTTDMTYDTKNRQAERIVMLNFFDIRRKSHT